MSGDIRRVSIFLFNHSDFTDDELRVDAYNSSCKTFYCSSCREDYEVTYVLSPDYRTARRMVLQGKGLCEECLIDELDNYTIVAP